MLFEGEWCLCGDGDFRPIVRAEILGRDGSWCAAELLVDTGADRPRGLICLISGGHEYRIDTR